MSRGDTQGASLVIQLFGAFDVQIQGKPMPHPRTRKGQWLLALLILRQGRLTNRNWLAGQLWPESTDIQALANLRLSLTDLRRVLGAEAVRLSALKSQELAFDLTGALVDVCLFDLYAVSKEATRLEEAVALYNGSLLEGCTEEWVMQEREAREQVYLDALERRAALAHAQGDLTQAVSYLHRAATVDPLRESVQRKLMEALAAQGHLAEVTQVYRDLRQLLHREFNAEPDPETTALYDRLRQTARQQANLPRSLPQIASPASPRRLPQPLSALIGRGEQLEEILLRLASSRLVTLVGSGGIGKTRLAIEVAGVVAPRMPDGVFFVDLASLVEGSLIAHAVAQALELKEVPGQSLLDQLRAYLHGKRLLLLLDNCEHLIEESSTLTALLLESCPQVRILATSRQVLGITGEVSYRVPSLPVPPANFSEEIEKDRLPMLLDYASVRLFVERASASTSDFAVTAPILQPIVQICRRLDGIPLALEMAAARVKALSVAQIAERLEASFALLSGGSRTALPRQQTLRAMLDWSWNLLSDSEQALLRRLSVFAGGWTLQGAEQVCALSPSDILDLLTSLVDKSLVMYEERHGAGRYRMLETVRQNARDRLVESGESDAGRGRHRDFFLALAEEAEPKLRGAEQAEWMQRLEAEHENLRASLDWSLLEVGSAAGLRLCGALQRFWWTWGHASEGREWCVRALEAAESQGRTPERAKVLNGVGVLANFQADYASAQVYHQESLAIRRELGDWRGAASSLNNLGILAYFQADYGVARAYFEEVLLLYRESGNRNSIVSAPGNPEKVTSAQGASASAIAYALNGLGDVSYNQCDYASSRSYYQESLDIWTEIGDRSGIAYALNGLGNVVYNQDDYASARGYFKESLAITKEIGDRSGIASSLHNLGRVAHNQGDYASARAYYDESLAVKKETGDRSGIAYSLMGLGNVARCQGDYASAIAYLEESLAIEKEIGDRSGMAYSLNGLGEVAFAQCDYPAAHAYYEKSLDIQKEIGDRSGIAASLQAFAGLAGKESKTRRAALLWGAAEVLREEIGLPIPPDEREEYNRVVAEVRQALGEAAFLTAWADGRAMPLEQVMDFATE